jgi:GPH family glycoside/pentoside/hexuronide:cation symporter
MQNKKGRPTISLAGIFGYAAGEGATSIIMNGTGNFYLLYLTQILGMSASWAALSFSICTFWDALTDPIMGHISDNTRSRWGRRHPYILIGGFFTALFFFSYWTLPQMLHGPGMIFASVLLISLLIRTAITVYMVPYMALGFEVCPEYESRTRLQGVRFFVNQITNFTFGALAWTLFFPDSTTADGSRLDGTFIASNYGRMGAALALGAVLLIIVCAAGTRRFAVDNRTQHVQGNSLRAFWTDFSSIFRNRLAVLVFVFFIVAQFSMILTGTVQMFTYVHYMQFTAVQKSCVHGAGMIAFALAAYNVSKLVSRFDKKGAGYIGAALASFGGLGLLAVFTGGLLSPHQTLTVAGHLVPVAIIVFALLQVCWWGGCGMVVPLANSMVADVAAIEEHRTGESRNASYAAVFSFSTKAAASVGILVCGLLVDGSGIVSGAETQTAEAVRNISIITFVCGPVVILTSLLILRCYPVTREYMKQLEEEK